MEEPGEVVRDADGAITGVRRAKARAWTATDKKDFLEELAVGMNVRRAAAKVGRSEAGAYQIRNRDAAFRQGWAEAIREGYEHLERILLERAMHGTQKVVAGKDGSERVMREYSERLALALLSRHADTVERLRAAEAVTGGGARDGDEVRREIEARLDAMAARLRGGAEDGDEPVLEGDGADGR